MEKEAKAPYYSYSWIVSLYKSDNCKYSTNKNLYTQVKKRSLLVVILIDIQSLQDRIPEPHLAV